MTSLVGPMADTVVEIKPFGERFVMRGVIGGYPRCIVGETHAALIATRDKMKHGNG